MNPPMKNLHKTKCTSSLNFKFLFLNVACLGIQVPILKNKQQYIFLIRNVAFFSVAPIKANLILEIENFEVGQSYNISCQVVGSNPLPEVKISVGLKDLEIVHSEVSSNIL